MSFKTQILKYRFCVSGSLKYAHFLHVGSFLLAGVFWSVRYDFFRQPETSSVYRLDGRATPALNVSTKELYTLPHEINLYFMYRLHIGKHFQAA